MFKNLNWVICCFLNQYCVAAFPLTNIIVRHIIAGGKKPTCMLLPALSQVVSLCRGHSFSRGWGHI